MGKKVCFFVLFMLLTGYQQGLLAQKPVTPPKPAGANYKKPNVKTYLGTATGNVRLTAIAAKQLVALPLKIIDNRDTIYTISSYQLAYKRIGITEDEETGTTSPQSDLVANRFTTTPLPPVWQKNITELLHTGEELYFFDIIVFDKQGRRFFAPELKISVL